MVRQVRSNPNRADRIAREMVDEFTILADIEDGLTERLDVKDLQRLFLAIDPEYSEHEKRLDEIEEWMQGVSKEIFADYEAAYWSIIRTRQQAYFNLSFYVAVKLLGKVAAPPKFKLVDKDSQCA